MSMLPFPSPGASHPGAPPLSMRAYFACVLLVTACIIGVSAWLQPSFRADLADWAGLTKPMPAVPHSFYSVRVAPILDAHCTGCHGVTRAKGKLRLDNYTYLMRGGRHGPVVRPGDTRTSPLFVRIGLPPDDLKVMPPKGKAPLSADEMTVLRLWVVADASPSLPVSAIKGAPPLPKQIIIPEFDAARVSSERAALAKAVQSLQARFPGGISYVSRGSADLDVDVSLFGPAFGDAELALLAPVQEKIVSLDASRTGITDASAARLAAMRRLSTLRLADTTVGGGMASALTALPSLRVLTVVATRVQPADLKIMRERGVKIYATSQ